MASGCAPAEATADLDINQVQAGLYNGGNLFWKGAGPQYRVPKTSKANAIFAGNLWVGGMVDGELHMAASDYGPYEFWPGPLDELGRPLCEQGDYDRLYKVSLRDIREYTRTGHATADLLDWPWALGAPVKDGDGNPDNYNLAGGDRPEIKGHQTVWWVMNDKGNEHAWSLAPPLGLELQVTAYAYAGGDPVLDYTTFYTYTLINKGGHHISDMYFGNWVDVDLGDAGDDYIGSDSLLHLGYVWNGDDYDAPGYRWGYGTRPPALGYTILEGPRIAPDGLDNDRDGTIDEVGERQGLGAFVTNWGDSTVQGNPGSGDDAYRYLKALWRDDVPFTYGGTGRGFSSERTRFMFSGEPPAFWSEENVDNSGSRNTPADRNFLLSTGPFDLPAGSVQEITLAIVWQRGQDRYDSLLKLKQAVTRLQAEYENGYHVALPSPPDTPPTLRIPDDKAEGLPTDPTFFWEHESIQVTEYQIQWAKNLEFTFAEPEPVPVFGTEFRVADLEKESTYYWRVRAMNAGGYGPWSEVRQFHTGPAPIITNGPRVLESGQYAFVEVVGPGGADPCGPGALSTYGCDEVGGNAIYRMREDSVPDVNSTGVYALSSIGSGPEGVIGAYGPSVFEIRFSVTGSYAYHPFTTGHALKVPFEIWDIGRVEPFGPNDPEDDVQLIPNLFSDNGGECTFGYGEIGPSTGYDRFGLSGTDRIYAYYPDTTYTEWADAIRPLVEADSRNCPSSPITDDASNHIDFGRGRPLQRIVVLDTESIEDSMVDALEGTIVRFYTLDLLTQPPMPAHPGQDAVLERGEAWLWWYAAEEMTHFDVQVATDPTFSGPFIDQATNLQENHYVVRGLADQTRYYWRVRGKLEEGGETDWSAPFRFEINRSVSTETDFSGIPQTIQLAEPYPNPFYPETQITFGLPKPSSVRLAVYNILGQQVATLLEETKSPGWHHVRWDANGYGSGVYLVRMEAGGFQTTKKGVVVK